MKEIMSIILILLLIVGAFLVNQLLDSYRFANAYDQEIKAFQQQSNTINGVDKQKIMMYGNAAGAAIIFSEKNKKVKKLR